MSVKDAFWPSFITVVSSLTFSFLLEPEKLIVLVLRSILETVPCRWCPDADEPVEDCSSVVPVP